MIAFVLAHGSKDPEDKEKVPLPPGTKIGFCAEAGQKSSSMMELKAIRKVLREGASSIEELALPELVSAPDEVDNYHLQAEDLPHVKIRERLQDAAKGFAKFYFAGHGELAGKKLVYCTAPSSCRSSGKHTCEGILSAIPEKEIVMSNCRVLWGTEETAGMTHPKYTKKEAIRFGALQQAVKTNDVGRIAGINSTATLLQYAENSTAHEGLVDYIEDWESGRKQAALPGLGTPPPKDFWDCVNPATWQHIFYDWLGRTKSPSFNNLVWTVTLGELFNDLGGIVEKMKQHEFWGTVGHQAHTGESVRQARQPVYDELSQIVEGLKQQGEEHLIQEWVKPDIYRNDIQFLSDIPCLIRRILDADLLEGATEELPVESNRLNPIEDLESVLHSVRWGFHSCLDKELTSEFNLHLKGLGYSDLDLP